MLCTWKLYHVPLSREAPAVDKFWVTICEVCVISLGVLLACSQPVTQVWGVACIWLQLGFIEHTGLGEAGRCYWYVQPLFWCCFVGLGA